MASLDQDRFRGILQAALEKRNAYQKKTPPNRYGASRLPFLIGRDSDKPENYISFWVNPSQCGWKVGTRTTIEKVAGGAIHHEWPTVGLGTQESNILLDHPVVSFSFQSGAISVSAHEHVEASDPSQTTPDYSMTLPEGLGNFYDFLSILNKSNLSPGGIPNYVNIFYTSNIFPNLWLQGFFTEEGVNWDDGADNPNQVGNWGASFMVFNSMPDIGSTDALRDVFDTFGFQAWSA